MDKRLIERKRLILSQLKMFLQEVGEIESGKMAEDVTELLMDLDYDVEAIVADYDKKALMDELEPLEDDVESNMKQWEDERSEMIREYENSRGVR